MHAEIAHRMAASLHNLDLHFRFQNCLMLISHKRRDIKNAEYAFFNVERRSNGTIDLDLNFQIQTNQIGNLAIIKKSINFSS